MKKKVSPTKTGIKKAAAVKSEASEKPKPSKTLKSAQKAPVKPKGITTQAANKKAIERESHTLPKGDPDGDNRPTLPDGRRFSIGNPDEEKPGESWESRMAREQLQEEERNRQKSFWKMVLETERFNEEGIISVAEEEKLSDPPTFLYLGLITEQMKFQYGEKADWRVYLCKLARVDMEARKELSQRLTKAATEANTVEMAAFHKAVFLIRRRKKKGAPGKYEDSKFSALLYVIRYWRQFKKYPTHDEVEEWIRKNELPFPEPGKGYQQGSKRYRFFDGPILKNCIGRAGTKPNKSAP